MVLRPNTTLSSYSSIDPQTGKNRPRDFSESFVIGSSRNNLNLEPDSQPKLSVGKEEHLFGSFHNTSMNAMDILRKKQGRINSMRRSGDQNILRSFQSESIADLNELRNKSKLNRQNKDFTENVGLATDKSIEQSKAK